MTSGEDEDDGGFFGSGSDSEDAADSGSDEADDSSNEEQDSSDSDSDVDTRGEDRGMFDRLVDAGTFVGTAGQIDPYPDEGQPETSNEKS